MMLLLACASPSVLLDESPEPVPGIAESCDPLYNPYELRAFDLGIDDAELTALAQDDAWGDKEEHEARLSLDDETVDASVRLRGNPDFSWWTEKWQFVVSFEPDRFHGLRALGFDAPWYDPTLLRDRLAWAVLAELDVPSLCASSATLSVNGGTPGVYTHIEEPDHEWLERRFGHSTATGTLWKDGKEPVSNAERADPERVERFFAATSVADLEEVGSAEQFALAWAAEAVLGQTDGYWCCNHNFYLYDHPWWGIVFVPWDFDFAWEMSPYDTDPVEGYAQDAGLFAQGPFRALVEDPEGRATYRAALARVLAAMEEADPVSLADAWSEAIAEAVADDPSRSFTVEEHAYELDRLRAWIPARVAYLEAWLACDAGAADDGDDDGYDDCEDTDDGDPAVHASGGSDGECVARSVDGARYLFCGAPRTQADATARCEAEGLELVTMTQTSDWYMTYVWTWPPAEPWWVAPDAWGCLAWDGDGLTRVDCAEAHPSVCG